MTSAITISPITTEAATYERAFLECFSASSKLPFAAASFALLAAMMAHIPVGQKQHKQERTAGPIQFWGTGVRLISIPSGCVTIDVITWPWALY